jgi:hypothetical protein
MDIEQHRAKSQYRQLRLVITQELSGLVTYRLHGKEYEEDWNEHTLLLHGQIVHHESIAVLEDAISLCLGILSSQLLPESSDPQEPE